MDEHSGSITANAVAVLRAMHQLLDYPLVFDDPLAIPVLNETTSVAQFTDQESFRRPGTLSVRAYVVARSRFAEDHLAMAVARGARQYVILGAGFDTFAYRNPYGEDLAVFEVDYPSTQIQKRYRLKLRGIPIPPSVHFVPFNMQNCTLLEALRQSGFQSNEITFFSLMGVSYYLLETSFWQVLNTLAGTPLKSGLVLDLFVPVTELTPKEQLRYRKAADYVSSIGEPYQLHLDPEKLCSELRSMNFSCATYINGQEINKRYFRTRNDQLAVNSELVRLVSAIR